MTALIIIAAIVLVILLTVNIPVYAHIRYYGGKAEIKVRYAFLTLYPRKKKAAKKRRKRRQAKPDGKKEKRAAADKKPSKPPAEVKPPAPQTEDTSPAEAETAETDISAEIPAAEDDFDDEFIFDSVFDEEDIPEEKPAKKKISFRKKEDKKADAPEEKDGEEKLSAGEKLSKKLDELAEKKNALQLLLELIGKPLIKLGGKVRIDDIIIDFASADEDAAKAAVKYGSIGAAVYNTISLIRTYISVSVRSVKISCLYNTPSKKSRYDGECKIKLRPASLINAVFAVVFGYLFRMKKYAPVMTLIKK